MSSCFLNKMKTKIQNSQKNLIKLVFLAVFMNLYTLSLLLAILVRVSVNFEINLKKPFVYNEHYPSILVPFLGRPSILVGKMEH